MIENSDMGLLTKITLFVNAPPIELEPLNQPLDESLDEHLLMNLLMNLLIRLCLNVKVKEIKKMS